MIHLHEGKDYPDVGNGEVPCCMGSVLDGPSRCTCWKPVYDTEQQPRQPGPMLVRARMCDDCAFRPGSPERQGDARYAHSGEDGLEDLMSAAFVCHKGLRRLVKEVHPCGAEHVAPPGAYEPPMPVIKADGSPAEYCAGWAAERARREREGSL